jgi:signal transduction histidine kinase
VDVANDSALAVSGVPPPAEAGRWRTLPQLLSVDLDPEPEDGPRQRTVRDWAADIAAVLIAAALGTLGVWSRFAGHNFGGWRVADVAVGAAACLSLGWRRRWPVEVAVALSALSLFSLTAGGAAAVATFAVAVRRPLRTVAWVGLFGVATGAIHEAVFPDPTSSYLTSAVIIVLGTGLIVGWGSLVRARRQVVMSLAERARRAEADQQLREEEARRAERTRIAREMHDVLAHRLSLLSVHAGALEFRPNAPREEIARAAGVIRSSAHQALEDLREVIGLLREEPSSLPESPQPSITELGDLVEESRQGGMKIKLDDRVADKASIPATAGRTVYRVVQEGLTNARKHAPKMAVSVTVDGAPGKGLTLEVRQPLVRGRAEREIPGSGTGLVGVAERISLVGGQLEHGPTRSGEYRLWAWLPWSA